MFTFKGKMSLLAFWFAACAGALTTGALAQDSTAPQEDAAAPAAPESGSDSPPDSESSQPAAEDTESNPPSDGDAQMPAVVETETPTQPGADAQSPLAADPEGGATPEANAAEPTPTIPVTEIRSADEPAAADTTAESGTTRLDDVIVTSTKRAQSVRDIAASIDAFSGEKLESEGKINLADYLETKPGVTISGLAPNLLRISIRGISTDTSGGSGLPSPTGVFIGDTAFSDPYIANIQPDFNSFDLSSVEILKGPQGTLFGGAALAGAIRFVMQEPLLGTWQSRAFSQFDLPAEGSPAMGYGAVFNAPFGDDFALRLGYQKREYPAVYDNSREDVGRKDVDGGFSNQYRALASWRPGRLGVKFTHLSQDSDTRDGVGFADSAEGPRENNKKILPQPSVSEFGLDSIELGYDFESMRAILLASKTHKEWEAYVDGTAALYGTPPERMNPNLSGFSNFIDISNGRSYELRLQSTDGEGLQWLGGLYYFDYDVFFEVYTDVIANQRLNGASGYPGDLSRSESAKLTSLLYAVANVTAFEKAVFADLSHKFFDERLDVSVGARYYETQVKGGFFGTGLLARSQNNGEDINYSNNEILEDGVNPKFSAAFELTPEVTVWAGASRGFRFGGLQSVPSPGPTNVQDPSSPNNVPPAYKSDTLWNYELGTRTSWMDNTLHFDTTLFYIDYKDPQLSQSTVGGVVNYGYTDNVGGARSQGIETSLNWLTPIDGVRLDLAAGLTDAVTTEDFSAAGGQLVPAGSKMPGAADYQYSVGLAYVAPPLGIFNLAGRVDYSYLGPTKADIKQTQDVNDYGTLNAGLTLSTLAWRLKPTLALNVSNILDEVAPKHSGTVNPVTNTSFIPLPGGPPVGEPYSVYYLNAPRTITLRIGLEF